MKLWAAMNMASLMLVVCAVGLGFAIADRDWLNAVWAFNAAGAWLLIARTLRDADRLWRRKVEDVGVADLAHLAEASEAAAELVRHADEACANSMEFTALRLRRLMDGR